MQVFMSVGIIVLGLISLVSALNPLVQSAPPPPPILTAQLEVVDLIHRLRPIVDNPDKPWYSNGLTLTFTAADVDLKLKLPNGNEYHGHGQTLRDAVSRITSPSDDIRKLLEGW